MIAPDRRMARLILALCDELKWGLRFFFAYKVLHKTEVSLTPTLFETFYIACLDQSCLILSRMVVANPKFKDNSVNMQYLLEQAKNNPHLFQFAKAGEVEKIVGIHFELLESYQPLMEILKDQRDRNLAHLDLKNIKQPEWRESQPQLVFDQIEQFYSDLAGVLKTYHRLFFGGEIGFEDWEKTSQTEVGSLIDFYEAYNSKN
jgi:hypothetical protein